MKWPTLILRTPNEKSEKGFTETTEVRISTQEAALFDRLQAEKPNLKEEKKQREKTMDELRTNLKRSFTVLKIEQDGHQAAKVKIQDLQVKLEQALVDVNKFKKISQEADGKSARYKKALTILQDKPIEVTCHFPVYPSTETTWTPFVQGHGPIKDIVKWALTKEVK